MVGGVAHAVEEANMNHPPIDTPVPESYFCSKCGTWIHDGDSAYAPMCFSELMSKFYINLPIYQFRWYERLITYVLAKMCLLRRN